MYKIQYLFSTLILVIIIIGCCYLSIDKQNDSKINSSSLTYNSITKQLPIAKIIIPKINLENNLFSIDTKENQVDRNVTILKPSVFPDQDKSILFIAAHSGTGGIAYFKNLDRLHKNDKIEFIYKSKKYIYNITHIFEEKKDGDIEINRTSNHQLVLTTCSQTHKDMQLVINSELIQKEES